MDIKFNGDDLEKAVMRAAQSGMRNIADELTRDYAEMARRLEGHPLEEIKAELVRYHTSRDGEISEPELTEYAKQLQDGGEVVFEYGRTTG